MKEKRVLFLSVVAKACNISFTAEAQLDFGVAWRVLYSREKPTPAVDGRARRSLSIQQSLVGLQGAASTFSFAHRR